MALRVTLSVAITTIFVFQEWVIIKQYYFNAYLFSERNLNVKTVERRINLASNCLLAVYFCSVTAGVVVIAVSNFETGSLILYFAGFFFTLTCIILMTLSLRRVQRQLD